MNKLAKLRQQVLQQKFGSEVLGQRQGLEMLYHLKEQFKNLDDEPEREPGRMGKCGKNHGQHIHQAVPHDQPGNAVEVI